MNFGDLVYGKNMDEGISTCFLNHNLASFHYACADKKNVNKRIMSLFLDNWNRFPELVNLLWLFQWQLNSYDPWNLFLGPSWPWSYDSKIYIYVMSTYHLKFWSVLNKMLSDKIWRQLSTFLQVLRFPPPLQRRVTTQLKYC